MADESRCPRCSGPFVCGADEQAPCACFAVNLSDAARASLRAAFTACVCVACLRDVQAQCDDLSAARPPGAN